MAYCTSTDIERYCEPAAGVDISDAIDIATKIVDAYTNDIHGPRNGATIYSETNRAAIADIPYTVRSISGITLTETGESLPSTAWTLINGPRPRVRINNMGGTSILVAGFEPWATGAIPAGTALNISGNFGPSSTPAAITDATAMIAAAYLVSTGRATYTAAAPMADATDPAIASITVEGYSVSYRDITSNPNSATSTTGITPADRLLAPYRRNKGTRWS